MKFLIMTTLLLATVLTMIPTKAEGATLSVDANHDKEHYVTNGKIVFTRKFTDMRTGKTQTQIFIMNPDGSDITQLTHKGNNEYPSWSRDGKKIVFDSNRTGNYQIFIMHDDGSGQTRVTHDKNDYWEPSWSADGTKITCSGGGKGPNWGNPYPALFIMNADGSHLRQLTDCDGYGSPCWSPDGTKIVFQCCHSQTWSDDAGIYVMDIKTKERTPLFIGSPSCSFHPNWSPDGAKIMFSRCFISESGEGLGQALYVINADGTNPIRLTYPPPLGCY